MAVTVRRVAPDEAASLTRLAISTFVDTYGSRCRAADIEHYLAVHLTDAVMAHALSDPAGDAVVAEEDGDWLGYALVRRAALPLHTPPVSVTHPTELVRFYVRQSHHGRGVAGQLLEAVLETGVREGSDGLWLLVWQENARAIAYYQKNGFRIVGTSTFQMGDEIQDDFVMLRTESGDTSR